MGDLIDRAPGDDVIVAVRMRRSSFEKLTSTPGACLLYGLWDARR